MTEPTSSDALFVGAPRTSELETPQAAAMSCSAPEASIAPLVPAARRGLRLPFGLVTRVSARIALAIAGGAAAILATVVGAALGLSSRSGLIFYGPSVHAAALAASLAAAESVVDGGAREQVSPEGSRLEPRLDLPASHGRVGKAVLVEADLRASLAGAGLASVDDMVSMLDDALDGHTEIAGIHPGARLRLVATQEQVDGAFVRWVSLEAVEYFPAVANAEPVRVYSFADGDDAATEAKRHRGWYDAKGRQPLHGGFRSPVPLPRITSRFNLHRMHPVLHVVMPHYGVDFASPVGAPVYATAAGVVTGIDHDGPCGNHVEIAHAGGIASVYCHLSRFAPNLHVGQRVEQRQLVAFVGQTGRVTGPHLHFGIRKNGAFIDPMTLRLDGFRVVPKPRRDDFDRQRAELDTELDGIPLPASSESPAEAVEADTIYEEP